MSLTDRESRFVDEYLADLNSTRAAVAVGLNPRYGRRIRWKPEVAAAIAEEQRMRGRELTLTTHDVLARLMQVAWSDASEVMEIRRVNCRHCHGRDFHRQFTKAELLDRHDNGLDPIDPHNAGVFDPWEDPHPDCPQCGGLGEVTTFLKDSRYLTPAGRAIYAGLRQTRRGLELIAPDQTRALIQLGKHLGLFGKEPPPGPRRMTHEEATAYLARISPPEPPQ